jgi:hypothetical protein
VKPHAIGLGLAACLFAAAALGREVVVLKGGSSIELKTPWMTQGSNAILTRADGTVLSVPLSEIDLKATAAARKASPRPDASLTVPAQTPVEATRAIRAVPKARVRLTDADVSHESVLPGGLQEPEEKKDTAKGAARLEVVGYDQSKVGSNLLVRGSLRNVGATAANNARLSVTALDLNGNPIGTGEAGISKGNLESFETVAFTTSIPVGDKIMGTLRFAPQWIAAPLPATPAEAAAAQKAASPSAPPAGMTSAAPPASQPTPQPIPYGQGLLYAAPAANASSVPPEDSRTGYLPGASDPASQPKPPNL